MLAWYSSLVLNVLCVAAALLIGLTAWLIVTRRRSGYYAKLRDFRKALAAARSARDARKPA